MEKYLSEAGINDEDIIAAISDRQLFPCFFGSALKMNGVDEFVKGLDRFTAEPLRDKAFGAMVYKISYDAKGSRLTHMKITGGELRMREEINYKNSDGEDVSGKISSIRFYSGDKIPQCGNCRSGRYLCCYRIAVYLCRTGDRLCKKLRKNLFRACYDI